MAFLAAMGCSTIKTEPTPDDAQAMVIPKYQRPFEHKQTVSAGACSSIFARRSVTRVNIVTLTPLKLSPCAHTKQPSDESNDK